MGANRYAARFHSAGNSVTDNTESATLTKVDPDKTVEGLALALRAVRKDPMP